MACCSYLYPVPQAKQYCVCFIFYWTSFLTNTCIQNTLDLDILHTDLYHKVRYNRRIVDCNFR